ncbi:MAG TPA: IclR family transcriptional regulator [Firmicutes bacterium]|nr:IclR family transcriptional regulator [Bacillota bacterium]
MPGERTYLNTSLNKALKIIDLFSFDRPELSIKEIADSLGLNASSIYPLVVTLTKFRYLEKDPERKKYRLGIKFLEKGYIVQAQLDIRECASPYLEELRVFSKENVHLAVLDGSEIVYIDRHETRPTLPIESRIGKRAPAYCTGLGKVLLAWTPPSEWEEAIRQAPLKAFTEHTITDLARLKEHLKVVCAQGYAIDDEEFQPGGYCIAAPIHDYRGRVVAAVSVSLAKSTLTPERKEQLVKAVVGTASNISARLGFGPGVAGEATLGSGPA